MSFSSLSAVTGLNFPKTNGLGFLNCFLGKLEELLHSKLDLITKLKPQIVLVKEGLLILRSFFNHTEETYDENDEICGLIISATEMAYEADDDEWDTTAWDYLNMCFLGSQSRSRIILTTRLYEVSHYAKCNSEPHRLRLLTDKESWKLLQGELFHGQSFPSKLGDVGLRIAKRGKDIPVSKLSRVWLAEGIVEDSKEKVSEDAA
ncbi:hypothetical protein MTR67_039699 [Solanum verrucosum]|uniref:NB-ARC domain-containing protein n=1 Tax=Solanum verrucosum TaxID=315347 RepID=A0AAF0UI74_SOLVR|nr:hypothetical protein MTR67_039699 [Solanum verrucosum]